MQRFLSVNVNRSQKRHSVKVQSSVAVAQPGQPIFLAFQSFNKCPPFTADCFIWFVLDLSASFKAVHHVIINQNLGCWVNLSVCLFLILPAFHSQQSAFLPQLWSAPGKGFALTPFAV